MHRWKLSALAAAAFVSAALSSTDAAALALGPISVHSSLGENLRADIAIPQITPAEMDSLLANIASPEVFRAQGMDYSAAARTISIELQRNTDGTARLQLSSSAPITDPFLDLVLQTNWHSGHLVRSYTLLLDPPLSTRAAAAPIAAAQIAPQASPALPQPPAITGRSYSSNAAQAPAPTTAPAAARAAPVAAPAPSTPENVTVRLGQTAGQVANTHRAPGVSLDQMLVAMLRSNPDAFINGNVNRIRAGTVVQIPSREQALETSAPEARRIVAAQSRDFNAYRRSLASKAPTAAVKAADRSSGGQVQAHVEDASPAAANSDKLTLSKGSAHNAAANEQQLAEQKQAQDQSERLNELQRNLTELNQLTQNSTAPATALATAPAAATSAPAATPEPASSLPATPAVEVTQPAPTSQATAPADAAPTSVEAVADTAASTPSEPAVATATEPTAANTQPAAPAAAAKPAQPAAPSFIPAPTAQPTLWDQLKENPLIPAGTAALALLLGLLGYRTWKKRSAASTAQDPALGDSQLQSDSFFGGSGGQQVDTNSSEGATTMAYSPSQLDGGGDVDPVAEADVYLAYGRDVQAEEILKEALRNHPERLAVHMKLAEIYAKRQDLKALEQTARTLQELSPSDGADWQRVVNMGRSLDPTNPFYAAAAPLESASKPKTSFAEALESAKPLGATAAAAGAGTALAQSLPDLDLNLDLDLPGGLADSQPAAASSTPRAAIDLPSDEAFASIESHPNLDTQLDLSVPSPTDNPPTLVADTQMPNDVTLDISGAGGLDFDLSNFNIHEPAATPAPTAASAAQVAPSAAKDEVFDLGADLNFDLDTPAPAAPAPVDEQPKAAAPVPTTPVASTPAQAAGTADMGLDFDLGALNLDTGSDESAAAQAQSGQNDAQDALTTKLDLAQEFNAIGDSEGARALIEEVLAEASGAQKARAQKMLSEID